MNLRPKETLTDADFDKFLSHLRETTRLMGIRQRDLAAALHLKPSQLNLYFNGKVEMRATRLLQLLSVLGIDVESLLIEKIKSVGGDDLRENENRVLARISRLDSVKRKSLLRIIDTLGKN